jgi:hypothetical protein
VPVAGSVIVTVLLVSMGSATLLFTEALRSVRALISCLARPEPPGTQAAVVLVVLGVVVASAVGLGVGVVGVRTLGRP